MDLKNKNTIKKKIETEETFIYSKKYDYDINILLGKYGAGCSNKIICTVLMLKPNELNKIYNKIVMKLKQKLNGDDI